MIDTILYPALFIKPEIVLKYQEYLCIIVYAGMTCALGYTGACKHDDY